MIRFLLTFTFFFSFAAVAEGRVSARTGYVRLLNGEIAKEWPEVGDHVTAGTVIDAEKESSLRASFGESFLHVGARSRLEWVSDGAFRLLSGCVRVSTRAGSPAVLEIGAEKISVSAADVIAVMPDRIFVLAGQVSVQGRELTAGQVLVLGQEPASAVEADAVEALKLVPLGATGAPERKLILSLVGESVVQGLILDIDKVAYEKHIGD